MAAARTIQGAFFIIFLSPETFLPPRLDIQNQNLDFCFGWLFKGSEQKKSTRPSSRRRIPYV
ncbi:hypothetical protein ES703_44756 [subsurface metagenome]